MSLLNIFKKKDSVGSGSGDVNYVVNESKIEKPAEKPDDEVTAVISAVLATMNEEETETVAAITAAVACILGKSTSEFVVRNIRRSPEIESVWSFAGKMQLMR